MKKSGRSSQVRHLRECRCAGPFPSWERQRGGGFAAQKGSQPRLAALGSPFQRKGLAWTLPPMEGGAPKGRRLDGGSGMKKIGGDRLKCVVYESTRAPLRGPPSPRGKATTIRECRFSRIVRANTRICEKKNNDGQSFPRLGKVASEASRIGY